MALPVKAGDILRGSATMGAPSTNQTGGGNVALTTHAASTGQDSLARAVQALQAVQAMQAAAHTAAVNGANNLGIDPNHPGLTLPNVPNGLAVGGLQVAPGVPANLAHPLPTDQPDLWQGANLPTQTASGGTTDVTIKQTSQQALLNWETFDIGKQTTLTFDQTAGGANVSQWIAFNTIDDPTARPTQILGSLDAAGQVYIINQNGIIFGGSSQVNLHTLVASSLPINTNLLARGLLNNPDDQFLFSALPIPILAGGTLPAFNPPPPPNTLSGLVGDVTVQAGASLTSPTTADHVGGRIALVGLNVTNDGMITTPDGQTILAAGEQVAFTAHPSTDPSLRGLDTYIGQVGPFGSTATNSGLIEAPRADVTMAGEDVSQLGVIDSSTSVSLNGRIDLLADYNSIASIPSGVNPVVELTPSASGIVSLGDGSVTDILPELSSTERIVGTQLALPSQVNLQGLGVHFIGDSALIAPNANVTIGAGSWLPFETGYAFVPDDGQIYLDSGANIDVSGSANVSASVSENIIPVQLRGAELANDPLQRNGPLRGQTVMIDIRDTGTYNGQPWVGTPLADVSGYVALVQRTVGELTTAGGTIRLTAGDSVVIQPGASLNVSGGSIAYTGADVTTTKLISDGQLVDISQATPDRIYQGIYTASTETHPKWGITETTTNPLSDTVNYEPGYIQGGNGGTLSITAPSMALDGNFIGTTITGPQQRTSPPALSSLALAFESNLPMSPYFTVSPEPPSITFQSNNVLPHVGPFALDDNGVPIPLPSTRQGQVTLSPTLLGTEGFGKLSITNSDGSVTLPANVSLIAPAGGSLTISAANLDVQGSVTAPGGNLAFSVYDFSPYQFNILLLTPGGTSMTPPPDPTRGNFTLGASASLNVAGMVADDRSGIFAPTTFPLVTNGGSVSIKSYNTYLRSGSSIDVSGGVEVNASEVATYGKAGSITIQAGQDLDIAAILGGQLDLGAELTGFGGSSLAGSLSILAPLVQIGGTATNPDTLLLTPSFFDRGGFGSFTLTGLGEATSTPDVYVPAVTIAPGVTIDPVATSESIVSNLALPNDLVIADTVLPQALRTPVSLTFKAPGVTNVFTNGTLVVRGDFVMGAGSSILTDPKASVAISANTAAVLGSITAPGGAISVTGGANSSTLFLTNSGVPLPTVDLGPHSLLSAAGTTIFTPNGFGYRTGIVLPGGSITLSGNIVAEAGSVLNVSGATNDLDVPVTYVGQPLSTNPVASPVVRTRIDSSGGSISFLGQQELFTDATLEGAAGGPSAVGGSLSLSSSRFMPPGMVEPLTPLDVTLQITASGPTIPASFYAPNENGIGHAVVDSEGNVIPGQGYFAVADFKNGGLASLTLAGTVDFDGPVTLNVPGQLTVGTSGVIFADSSVQLTASSVSLGQAFLPPINPNDQVSPFMVNSLPFYFSPAYGSGNITVSGSLINVGNLSLQGIGAATLIARNGDIQGDGTFEVAGAISLTAGQIYPPTEVTFNIAAFDYNVDGVSGTGLVTINASGTRPLPLSAGGKLNVYATTINDGGVLRAPIGTVNVGSSSFENPPTDPISNQAFPTTDRLTIKPTAVISVSAVDPTTGQALQIPYGTNENGTSYIDPAGVDITASGVPGKTVTVTATTLIDQSGSTIDLTGGGDLFAYRFIPGLGGTVDILSENTSFAIVPGYGLSYAPFDPVYTNSTLSVGDQIYLTGSSVLPAGNYTLLPARYALLPGAILVTPENTTPTGATPRLDGSTLVSGYRFNAFTGQPSSQPLLSAFELASPAVVQQRAEYVTYSANSFLKQGAIANDSAVPRLPIDAGQLVLASTGEISVDGSVMASAPSGGLGGLVDINTPSDILIGGPGLVAPIGTLFLNAAQLSSFGTESLLIGGLRQETSDGTVVTVSTNNITLNNPDTPLQGLGITLAAKQSITLTPGSDLEQSSDTIETTNTLLIGDASTPDSGNGVLLQISNDPNAAIVRSGVDASTSPSLTIGAGAKIAGTSVILDSTAATSLSPAVNLSGSDVALDSGQISLILNNPGQQQATTGLVLSGMALQTLQANAQALSLLSYSSLDIYGTGEVGSLNIASLALHAGEIRSFNNNGGTVTFSAGDISLDNTANGRVIGGIDATRGELDFTANTIHLGGGEVAIDQVAHTVLSATGGILFDGAGGLNAQGSVSVVSPLITGTTASIYDLVTAGSLSMDLPHGNAVATVSGGLGATLTLTGESVTENSNIVLPSGSLTIQANGVFSGSDVTIGGQLQVAGTAQAFYDLVHYTDAGEITLESNTGNVTLSANSLVTVAAQADGGNAGTLTIGAPNGDLTTAGAILGSGGLGGNFNLDIASLPKTATLDSALNAGGFSQSRTVRVRTGDVTINGTSSAQTYDLSADEGSILVTGVIDAFSNSGGTIELFANSNLTLASGAQLNAAGLAPDAAGKSGLVDLETRGANNGEINIAAGSLINLSSGASAGGTLHLRAPQNDAATDLALAPIQGRVLNAGSIIAEAYRVFEATDGSIDNQESAVFGNGIAISNASAGITQRVLASANYLLPVFHVRQGAEIDNPYGDLTLSSDWDLSTYRTGPRKAVVDQLGNPLLDQFGNPIMAGVEPGILTLRAAGSIILNGSLSDGFGDSAGDIPYTLTGFPAPWRSPLLPTFADGTSQQSWSYRIVAGADFQASEFRRTVSPTSVNGDASLTLGVFGGDVAFGGYDAQTDDAVSGHYQVIRTGTGDIEISVSGDVLLQNQFATIYTSGTQVSDSTLGGHFDLPQLDASGGELALGAVQESPAYPAQYSFGGGNVSISAGGDIEHVMSDGMGNLVPDSERQLPDNWLYRRGYIDPTTGQFGVAKYGDIASTSWWVDFSNFFEGVGALGGGNVTLTAGHDINNVDAVIPTNARLPNDTLDPTQLVELGGGNLVVHAGNDLNAGVYYVERGSGELSAGNSIITNSTRSPSLTTLTGEAPLPEQTWLPTTLFLGDGSFSVEANSDVTLGPVANPFLLPGGYSNTFWYKTYFSTYAATDEVDVSSLTGTLTLRESTTLPTKISPDPMLEAWESQVLLLSQAVQTPAYYEPWLRLDESDVSAFNTVTALQPPTLRATAFTGDLDFVGQLILSPAARGTIDLVAAGAINGLNQSGVISLVNVTTPVNAYNSGLIDLSDAEPSLIPGVSTPFAYQSIVGVAPDAVNSPSDLLVEVNKLFQESGSYTGVQAVLETKQALHAPGILHSGDPDPVHLYSGTGSISGFTLFSAKAARVVSGEDLTDVALYIQNTDDSNISVVSAARDIIAYDPSSPLRLAAQLAGNVLDLPSDPQAGDLQISGPGTLEVLAGRNLNLGIGASNPDGTGVGLTSIGNARNPYLPFGGADIVAGAGIGPASSLANSQLDFASFDNLFLNPATAPDMGARYLPDLAAIMGTPTLSDAQTWTAFTQLPIEDQDRLALKVFYLVLRDSGRDHGDPDSPNFNTYNEGYAAIAALFPDDTATGDLSLPSKEITTTSGGDIDLLMPGGGLTVGFASGTPEPDQGILTEDGGNISIFANNSVEVGTSRIFTLRGGNEIIWSTTGDIAAGASSKTVQSAPPTRVLIDPQSADVQTDLAGLATGGGIGVLDTVVGVPPGDVDLIAPTGVVDAGDAGIRVTGNLNISAVQVLNAGNISVAGTSTGVPTVAAPNLVGLTAASNAVGASTNAAETAAQQAVAQPTLSDQPSIVTVELLGYGEG